MNHSLRIKYCLEFWDIQQDENSVLTRDELFGPFFDYEENFDKLDINIWKEISKYFKKKHNVHFGKVFCASHFPHIIGNFTFNRENSSFIGAICEFDAQSCHIIYADENITFLKVNLNYLQNNQNTYTLIESVKNKYRLLDHGQMFSWHTDSYKNVNVNYSFFDHKKEIVGNYERKEIESKILLRFQSFLLIITKIIINSVSNHHRKLLRHYDFNSFGYRGYCNTPKQLNSDPWHSENDPNINSCIL